MSPRASKSRSLARFSSRLSSLIFFSAPVMGWFTAEPPAGLSNLGRAWVGWPNLPALPNTAKAASSTEYPANTLAFISSLWSLAAEWLAKMSTNPVLKTFSFSRSATFFRLSSKRCFCSSRSSDVNLTFSERSLIRFSTLLSLSISVSSCSKSKSSAMFYSRMRGESHATN